MDNCSEFYFLTTVSDALQHAHWGKRLMTHAEKL